MTFGKTCSQWAQWAMWQCHSHLHCVGGSKNRKKARRKLKTHRGKLFWGCFALCSPQNALAPHQMLFPPQASQIVTIGACAAPPRLHDKVWNTVFEHHFGKNCHFGLLGAKFSTCGCQPLPCRLPLELHKGHQGHLVCIWAKLQHNRARFWAPKGKAPSAASSCKLLSKNTQNATS